MTDSPFLDRSRWLADNGLAAIVDQPAPYGISEGHVLVVPLREIPSVLDMTDDEWGACITLIREYCGNLDLYPRGSGRPDGYNIGVNIGPAAGQTVDHAHIHIIPRYFGDHPNPRGGVRAVIPGKADYTEPSPKQAEEG